MSTTTPKPIAPADAAVGGPSAAQIAAAIVLADAARDWALDYLGHCYFCGFESGTQGAAHAVECPVAIYEAAKAGAT